MVKILQKVNLVLRIGVQKKNGKKIKYLYL